MSYNFIEEDECTMNIRSGLLAIYLIISAFLGYFIFTIFIILYCWQQKVKNQENSEEVKNILNKYKTEIPIAEVCGICLENEGGESVVLRCGHGFHSKCIEGWLEIKKLCPMCRSEQGSF
ncbi:unnamed protein product [Blepharisma stoltei]|uniref:RING-type domain-containing protein n=1 Tax=Blepharisma stoltei TaxID=1481888 RepID=A0AAU9J3K0_9CILI|nr:unnamed protein product [Blepharisma stoltei]